MRAEYCWLIAIAALLAVFLVIWICAGYKIYYVSFSRKRNPKPGCRKYLTSPDGLYVFAYDWDWLRRTSFDEVRIVSYDKTRLAGHLLKAEKPSHRYVIACHGYRGEWQELSVPCRYLYEKENYSLLMIEERGHGKSGYPIITFGTKERLDIVAWADYLVKFDPKARIVLYGLSMGAAAVMMASSVRTLSPNVKCVIEDCGFSSVKEELRYVISGRTKIPAGFLLSSMQLIAWLAHGFSFTRYSPVKSLRKSDLPMLFIHGGTDTYVPFRMLEENYQAKKKGTYKEKAVFRTAWHALSFIVEPERYMKTISSFISRFVN